MELYNYSTTYKYIKHIEYNEILFIHTEQF